MTAKRILLSCGVATAMISSSAFAAETTRSVAPSMKAGSAFGSRAIAMKKKNHLQEVGDTTDRADGTYVIAGLGVIAVIGGIIVAVDKNDDSSNSDSPG